MTGQVIILTGPPGSGKTTVAAILASQAATPTVHLVTDQFYRAIRTGFVPPYLPEAGTQNEVVIEVITASVSAYARGGYDVVVDGIVGPWFLDPFRAMAERHELHLSYVVLRPDLDTALARARARGGGELDDAEAITGLHHAFAQLDALETHVLDSTGMDASTTAAEVQRLVISGRGRLGCPDG